MTPGLLHIGGVFAPADQEARYALADPSSDAVIGEVADASPADVDRAVQAARRAFDGGAWPATGGAARGRLLWQLADLIEANADELVRLEVLNTGMPAAFARAASVIRSAEFLRYHAGWADKLFGSTIPLDGPSQLAYTLREPVGVVAAIVPWNVPLVNAVGKIAHALAAGCTMVLKVAEQTPLTALRLAELVVEAGFPAGVFNLLTGKGASAGQALVVHPLIDKIAFTGSTAVGAQILAAAAPTMKRVSLELGGKSPVIILPDADIERAAAAAANGIFANSGQVCIAGSRLFVHRAVHDRVLAKVVELAQALRVGPGSQPESQMGPLISRGQRDRVLGFVAAGIAEGAELLAGGKRLGTIGNFVQPTVFSGARPDSAIAREEIFGPVLAANRFDDDDLPAIAALANASPYGLSASIWTRDISRAHQLARLIRSGTVRINGGGGYDPAVPFGGYKQSGLGRENGPDGIKAYTELKAVTIAL